MTQKLTHVLLAALMAFGMIGCSKDEPPKEEPTQGGESEPDPEDVHLEGDRITIDEFILFALDSDEILPESSRILDHLARFIKNHADEVPALKIIGHTDTQGAKDYNQELSERRAAAVVAALKDRGITLELTSEGRGESDLECQENTEECHQQNRRVEFLIVR